MPSKASHKLVISGLMVLIVVVIMFTVFSVNKTEQESLPEVQSTTAQEIKQTTEATEVTEQQPDESVAVVKQEAEQEVEQDAANTESEITTAEATVTDTPAEKIPALPVVKVKLTEGIDYVTKFPDEQPKNQVLVEFFSFMCPHCYNFEPTLVRWKKQKPDSVEILKVPVSFGRKSWILAAKAFYIAEELSLVEEFSAAMFKKIHFEKKPPLAQADVGKIFATLGVSEKAFNRAANSFNINAKLRKADFLTRKYKVSGVPYFLVNYKYELGPSSFESEESLFRLWNNLPQIDFNE